MKNKSLLVIATFLSISVFSQQTRFYSDTDDKFKEAKEYFQKEQYSLAYPLFKELRQSVRETDKVNTAITVQEINFYTIACALKQGEGRAETEAQEYIDVEKNTARTQMMSYHLGEYYFSQQKFTEAAAQYEQTNIANLSNREIADMKFHQGYSYFTLQQFEKAKPAFNSIRTIKDDPNYKDANYLLFWLLLK